MFPRLMFGTGALALSRIIVAPQPEFLSAGILLRDRVPGTIIGRLFIRVIPIPPRSPDGQLSEANIQRLVARRAVGRLHHHLADLAPVTVGLVALQRGGVRAVGKLRQVLAGALPKGLSLLRGVDPGQSDLVLYVIGGENGEGIAVCN